MEIMMKRKTQNGFSLTELMLVLGVGATILSAAFLGYNSVSQDVKNQKAISGITDLATAIRSKWGLVGSYSGINKSNVITAGIVPPQLKTISTTHILHDYSSVSLEFMPLNAISSSTETVACTASCPYFRIRMAGVPRDMCSDLIVQADSLTVALRVGAVLHKNLTAATPVPLNTSTAFPMCSNSTIIYLYFT